MAEGMECGGRREREKEMKRRREEGRKIEEKERKNSEREKERAIAGKARQGRAGLLS